MPDQLIEAEERCKKTPAAKKTWDIYLKCGERLKKHEGDIEHTCAGYFFDYKNALNHCVAPTLFEKLK